MCGQHMQFQPQNCSFQCHTVAFFYKLRTEFHSISKHLNLDAFMYGRAHYYNQWKFGQYGQRSIQRNLVNQDVYLIGLLNSLTALTRFSLIITGVKTSSVLVDICK